MTHPLVQRLFDEYDYPLIDLDNHDAFVDQAGVNVLFFAGDPQQYRETTDVAVVLPELVAAFDGALRPGVVKRDRDVEVALQKRYGFRQWPCLVFVREGGYLGALERVQNWNEYLEDIELLMRSEAKRPPTFSIPVVTEA